MLALEAATAALDMPYEMLSTLTTLVMLGVGLGVLWRVCRPFTPAHIVLWGGMLALAVAGVAMFHQALELVPLGLQEWLLLIIFWAVTPYVLRLLTRAVTGIYTWWKQHFAAKQHP